MEGETPAAPSLSAQVAMATLALLSYRLLFYSQRELSITALIFCAACAWCTGQFVAVASGRAEGYEIAHENWSMRILIAPLAALASAARTLCQHLPISETTRQTCSQLTEYFL